MKKLLLAVLMLSFTVSCTAKEKAPVKDAAASKAIEFTLEDLSGKQVNLKDFTKKKVVLVVFWATWCPYCVEEIPDLKNLYSKLDKKSFEILSVNIQESKERVASFVSKNGVPYTILLDKNASVAQSYKVNGIPYAVLVDKKGFVQYQGNGLPGKELIEKLIKQKVK
ncbi:MAG: hypothetical protein A2252_09835 [Elusimicrobia bacterium RIFOXYA2_FULL_39_19]|nr:MAG: hypothetical protein A2252_09835 [Elusimicrobia bacterium RIFOXYA2_FULL_39_19]